MAKNMGVPNAWDDDWETQADKAAAREKEKEKSTQAKKLLTKSGTGSSASSGSKSAAAAEDDDTSGMTRAERLAKHEENNRRLWNSA